MEPSLETTVALLARTPSALEALLRDLPEPWTHSNEGENSWSAFEIVAHLIQAEKNNWITRAKWLLEFGETQAFEPFVRQPDEGKINGKSMAQILGEFAWLRSENLDALHALSLKPSDLARRGLHPTLGTVTLGELLATWAAHDLTHLHQLTRVMAHQYRETVGPFRKYLGVMHCNGHSEP
jgi:hypothetical protein